MLHRLRPFFLACLDDASLGRPQGSAEPIPRLEKLLQSHEPGDPDRHAVRQVLTDYAA